MVSLLNTREKFWQLSWRNALSSTQCKFYANWCIWLYPFPYRSPKKRLLNPTSSPLVGDKQPVREVSPQSSSESDQEEPVGMNQTPPTGANRTRSVGATISTAAQHASPKLILPSSCANDYYQPALISLLQKILNPQSKLFVLSYKPLTWIFFAGHNFVYSSANCPSWWPTDVPFTRAEGIHSIQYAYGIYMMCVKRQKKT